MSFEKFKTGLSFFMIPILLSMIFTVSSAVSEHNQTIQTKNSIDATYRKSLKTKLKPINISVITITNKNNEFTIVGQNKQQKIVTYQVDKLPTIDNQKLNGYYANSRIYVSPQAYKNHISKIHNDTLALLAKTHHFSFKINAICIIVQILGVIVLFIMNIRLSKADEKLNELLK